MSESPKRIPPLQLLDRLVELTGQYGTDVATSPIHELAPRREWVEAVNAVRDAIGELEQTIDLAWGLVANAGDGDWTRESDQWRDAAARWRDERYVRSSSTPATSERQRKVDQMIGAIALASNLARELWGANAVQVTMDGDPMSADGELEVGISRARHADRGLDEVGELPAIQRPRDTYLGEQGQALEGRTDA